VKVLKLTLITIGGFFAVMMVIGAIASLSTTTTTASAPEQAAPVTQSKSKSEPTTNQAPAKPEMTSGQDNALRSAQQYLDTMAFSKAGLIEQLSSSAGSGYSRADATFAANHVDVDWNQQAVKAAREYLDTMPMSAAELTQQLSSSAGSKFTAAQAAHAVSEVL